MDLYDSHMKVYDMLQSGFGSHYFPLRAEEDSQREYICFLYSRWLVEGERLLSITATKRKKIKVEYRRWLEIIEERLEEEEKELSFVMDISQEKLEDIFLKIEEELGFPKRNIPMKSVDNEREYLLWKKIDRTDISSHDHKDYYTKV